MAAARWASSNSTDGMPGPFSGAWRGVSMGQSADSQTIDHWARHDGPHGCGDRRGRVRPRRIDLGYGAVVVRTACFFKGLYQLTSGSMDSPW